MVWLVNAQHDESTLTLTLLWLLLCGVVHCAGLMKTNLRIRLLCIFSIHSLSLPYVQPALLQKWSMIRSLLSRDCCHLLQWVFETSDKMDENRLSFRRFVKTTTKSKTSSWLLSRVHTPFCNTHWPRCVAAISRSFIMTHNICISRKGFL